MINEKENVNKYNILVLGATGVQGGSVIKTLIKNNKYYIYGTTRNVESESSIALKKKGVKMIKCNLSKKEDIENAFENVDIIFAVTNFWDSEIFGKDPNEEERQGKMIADVAKDKNIKWLIWSSLPNVKNESDGKLNEVVHFTGKNNVEQYIKQLGIPATFVYLSVYYSTIGNFFKIYDEPNGTKILPIPYYNEKTEIEFVDAEDTTGPIVSHIIENKEKYLYSIIPISCQRLTFNEIAELYGKKIGKKIKVINVDRKIIAEKYPNLNNEEIIQMCEWYNYGVYGKNNISYKDTKNIYPNVKSFKDFLNIK
jgi:uncharacterized protein YbjT (DUF2867 family)